MTIPVVYFQKENFSCGPCSILNSMNHLGLNHNHDEYSLIDKLGAKPIIGVENEDIIEALNNIEGINISKYDTNGTIDIIKEEIDKGNVVIINYINAFSKGGHYSTIYKYDKDGLFFIDSSLGLLRLAFDKFENHWFNNKKTIYGFYVSIGKVNN